MPPSCLDEQANLCLSLSLTFTSISPPFPWPTPLADCHVSPLPACRLVRQSLSVPYLYVSDYSKLYVDTILPAIRALEPQRYVTRSSHQ